MPSTNTSTSSPVVTPSRDALHKPFSWLTEEAERYPLADFVAITKDICHGIQTCIELVNNSELDRLAQEDGNDVTPVLSAFDSSSLLRMALASSRLMALEADSKLEWIHKYGAPKMRAQSSTQSVPSQPSRKEGE